MPPSFPKERSSNGYIRVRLKQTEVSPVHESEAGDRRYWRYGNHADCKCKLSCHPVNVRPVRAESATVGLFRARQTEAELRAQAATQNVNDLANRVVRDLRVAYLAKTAFERIGLTDELLKQARLALDLAQSRYQLGLSSIVELSQAQLGFTSAQIGAASARYDYQVQRTVVDHQSGALR